MSDKIARLGIERDPDMMYYVKDGDVWATPRKQPGQPKGKARKVAATGIDLDYSKYLYFVDGDGDVARKSRALGGSGKRSAKKSPAKKRETVRSSITGHYVTDATAKRHPKETVTEILKPGRKKTKGSARTTARSAITGHYVTGATAKRHPKETVVDTVAGGRRGAKSEEQLDREIEEILGKPRR